MATAFPITENESPAVLPTYDLNQLSFTARGDDQSINLWNPVDVAVDWADQCRAGRAYGREAVDYIRGSGDAAVLQGIVRTIAERGSFGGTEIGFFAALSMALIESA